MSFLRPPTALAAGRETLDSLEWIFGQLTASTHILRGPPTGGSFTWAAFETVPWSDRDQQNKGLNSAFRSASARRAAIPLGFGDYVLTCTRSGNWYRTSHQVCRFIS